MPLNPEFKTKTITDFATHEGDTGSPEVQVAILPWVAANGRSAPSLAGVLKENRLCPLYGYRRTTKFAPALKPQPIDE